MAEGVSNVLLDIVEEKYEDMLLSLDSEMVTTLKIIVLLCFFVVSFKSWHVLFLLFVVGFYGCVPTEKAIQSSIIS